MSDFEKALSAALGLKVAPSKSKPEAKAPKAAPSKPEAKAPKAAPSKAPKSRKASKPEGKKPTKKAPKAAPKKDVDTDAREIREGKKPGVYVHIIRLLMKASKTNPLTDQSCYEALSKIKALKERFSTQEGKDGVWTTMKDAYRRTLITRMGWPVQEAKDKAGKVIGWYLSPKAKSENEFQQRKWERLNSEAK